MAQEPPRIKQGMILGKFFPPTHGHLYLARFGKRICDRLSVLVCSTPSEELDGKHRFEWMRELLPDCDVVHIPDDLPASPDDHPDFWSLWIPRIQEAVGAPIDLVFTSEEYGEELARRLGASHMVVDQRRQGVVVSGSAVRANPNQHWEHLPDPVKAWYCRRVVIFGPESTGKTTLAAKLAVEFSTRWVPEYARGYLDPKGGKCEFEDLGRIALGQAASEDVLARLANRVLVCDTDTLSTTIWSQVYFGKTEPWIVELADQRRHDLYLLCDVDVPWVDDAQRDLPHRRQEFFDLCKSALEESGRKYRVISGDWEQRFVLAKQAVEELLQLSHSDVPPAAQSRM